MELICKNCINLINVYYDNGGLIGCIYTQDIDTAEVIECTHFKAKPKENKELKQQAEKDLDKKGDNIIPTLCESCNCMTKTISTRTESYCGKCKKPKEDDSIANSGGFTA